MMIKKSTDCFLSVAVSYLALLCTLNSHHALATSFIGPKHHYFYSPGIQQGPLRKANPLIRGPVKIHLPKHYKRSINKKYPLLLSLHGFGGFPLQHEGFFKLRRVVTKKKFILATIPGRKNKLGIRFWNAGHWCCDFFKSGQNDIKYLHHVIQRLKKIYRIDEKKIALLGHSNGGFMAYRMLCESPQDFIGVISLAGTMPKGITPCIPPQKTSILHIHGRDDIIIPFEGNRQNVSAQTTMGFWIDHHQCSKENFRAKRNYIFKWGQWPKTLNQKMWSECSQGSKVMLWDIENEGHFADLTNAMRSRMIDFVFNESPSML
jgi:polyhydroxybutyrate depolymerase